MSYTYTWLCHIRTRGCVIYVHVVVSSTYTWLCHIRTRGCVIYVHVVVSYTYTWLCHIRYYLCRLEHFIIMGDFNSEAHENAMKEFCNTYNLKNLISKPACFKNPLNPSSIDVILTNRNKRFQNSRTLECGLSDHHKMIITVLKTSIPKHLPYYIRFLISLMI